MTLKLDYLFLFISLIGFYFWKIFFMGNPLLPSIFTILATIYFLFRHFSRIQFPPIIFFFFLLVLLNLLSFGTLELVIFFEKISKSIYIIILVTISYLMYLHLTFLDNETIKKTISIILLLLLLGTILQFFFKYFQDFNSTFGQIFYGKSDYIGRLTNELTVFNAYRPTMLSSEPSHFAAKICVLIVALDNLNKNSKRIFLFALSLIFLFLIKSPVMLCAILYFSICFLITFFKDKNHSKSNNIIIFTSLILISIFSFLIFNFLGSRLLFIATGIDTSFKIRFALPFLNLLDILYNYPLFGIGLTSGDQILSIIYDNAIKLNMPFDIRLFQSINSFLGFFSSFGILGSVIFINFLKKFSRKKFIKINLANFIFILSLSNFFGYLNIFLYQSVFIIIYSLNEK